MVSAFFFLSFNSYLPCIRCSLFLLCSHERVLSKHSSLEIENRNRGISCFGSCHVRIRYEVNQQSIHIILLSSTLKDLTMLSAQWTREKGFGGFSLCFLTVIWYAVTNAYLIWLLFLFFPFFKLNKKGQSFNVSKDRKTVFIVFQYERLSALKHGKLQLQIRTHNLLYE